MYEKLPYYMAYPLLFSCDDDRAFRFLYNSILTLMKLSLLPSGSISMHQRAEPVNTL